MKWLTLLRQYLRMGLPERRTASCRKPVSSAKVLDVLSSMFRLALKSFPKPTMPITSNDSLCTDSSRMSQSLAYQPGCSHKYVILILDLHIQHP